MKIKMENLERALRHEFTNIGGRRRKSRGPLHDRMTLFLPDFVDDGEKCCNLQRVAIALDMTTQGVYKFMKPGRKNRIDPRIAEALVELSELTQNKTPNFRPAAVKDFWDFVVI